MRDEASESEEIDRRKFIGGSALATASMLSGCAGLLGGGSTPTPARTTPDDDERGHTTTPTQEETASGPVDTVTLDVDANAEASEWTIDERIFGKFIEHNGRDIYPGIYSDHVANGSFEVWNTSGGRTAAIFSTDEYDNVAYPWVPLEEDGTITFEHVEGGVHGRRAESALESSDEIISHHRPDPAGVSNPRFQRVTIDGRGGVGQMTALPDHRTTDYVVKISVRGEDLSSCKLQLQETDVFEHQVLAEAAVDVTGEWTRHEVELSLDRKSEDRYEQSPFGEYRLAVTAEGDGQLDLDWAMLQSGDAVEGKFNPTTIELLQEYNVPSIRWPGGNFASQYHWRDGVGPIEDRPVVPNGNWGGLERNYLGTNEFLEFCEIAGIEPLLTVGSWEHIGPEEAADWVEYVNGDPEETDLGALRAEHGYEEPWDVTAWQVGNEVWGRWQIGHQSAADYADRYQAYDEAMTSVDPDIEVDATGIDPWYTDFRNGSYENRQFGTPPEWNETLFDRAGTTVEGVDIHRYSRGVVNASNRQEWISKNDRDPVRYNEVLVNYPTQFGANMEMLSDQAAERGIDDLRVNFGEWNLQPQVNSGWPRADYPTMAHATFMASMFQTFMRQGDTVRLTYQRDNTLFWRPFPVDLRPVNPGNYMLGFYAEPFLERDAEWHSLPVNVDGRTFTMPETGVRIREMADVPYVDATAIRSGDGSTVIVYVANRNLTDMYDVEFTLGEAVETIAATVQRGADGDPFARQTNWSHVLDEPVDGFELEELSLEPDEKGATSLEMPPASIAKLELEVASGDDE